MLGVPSTRCSAGTSRRASAGARRGSRARAPRRRGRRPRSARWPPGRGRATRRGGRRADGVVDREKAPGPGHARRGDPGAAVGLVLAGREHHQRDPVGPVRSGARCRGGARASRGSVPAALRSGAARGRSRGRANRARCSARRARSAPKPSASVSRCRRLPSSGRRPVCTTLPSRRRRVVPVHAVVVAQVGPAVARAEEAARLRRKRRGDAARSRPSRPTRRGRRRGCTGVVIAVVERAGSCSDVDVELALGERLEAHVRPARCCAPGRSCRS